MANGCWLCCGKFSPIFSKGGLIENGKWKMENEAENEITHY